jgi:NAD-dependent dihydropyrimidine dehydrogenase PreA subunit
VIEKGSGVAYIVAEPCIGVKDHACVDVCPVECFYEGEDQLFIHPDECIDCGACEPECPVDAIFEADQVPDRWKAYIAKNAAAFTQAHPLPTAVQKSQWESQRAVQGSAASAYYQRYRA